MKRRLGLQSLSIFVFIGLIASLAPSLPTLSYGNEIDPTLPTHRLAQKKKKNKKEPAREENQLSEKGERNLITFQFPLPESLRPNFEFWKLVYSQYDKNQAVVHDTEHLQVIYSVLNLDSPLTDQNTDLPSQNSRSARIRAEKERIRSILLKLADGGYDPKDLDPEEQKIYHLFDTVEEPDKFKNAAQPGRIRTQTGQKDKFLRAIEQSGTLLTEIEDIFTSYGLPSDLTRLIFVESMFNLQARSKVGASGLWQFMRQTGRLFLNINTVVDERNDPIAASHAAAQLLKTNDERLGNGALAINAYNAGALSLARAVDELGTDDIGVIAKEYSGGGYKFASRNFYAEFLAALEVANHYKDYFGEISRSPRFEYELFTPQEPLPLMSLTDAAGVSLATLEDMNPAFNKIFFSGKKSFPAGYSLKIPPGTSTQFADAARRILDQSLAVRSEGTITQ